jgi:hypothetical protein
MTTILDEEALKAAKAWLEVAMDDQLDDAVWARGVILAYVNTLSALATPSTGAAGEPDDGDAEAYQEGFEDGRSEAKGATVDFWRMAVKWAEQSRFIDPDGDDLTAQDLMDAILVAFGERQAKRRPAAAPPSSPSERDAALEAVGAKTEAVIVRNGPHIDVDWWRFGQRFYARVYEPMMLPLSPALADVLALALEQRPGLLPMDAPPLKASRSDTVGPEAGEPAPASGRDTP